MTSIKLIKKTVRLKDVVLKWFFQTNFQQSASIFIAPVKTHQREAHVITSLNHSSCGFVSLAIKVTRMHRLKCLLHNGEPGLAAAPQLEH